MKNKYEKNNIYFVYIMDHGNFDILSVVHFLLYFFFRIILEA